MSNLETLSDELLYRIFSEGAEHSALVDEAAAELIISRNRRDILPRVAEIIFRRNRRGEYIHDLVWCFFHDVSAEALAAVAEYLTSDDERDVHLARKLLHLPENLETGDERRNARDKYLAWLRDNRPFLYLTDEQLNYTSEPEALKCDIEARYLHHEILPKSREPVEPLTEREGEYLAAFRALPESEQELLSVHSLKLHQGDVHAWSQWLAMNTAEQVISAQMESEAV